MNFTNEDIGRISGLLIILSAIPYAIRTWQGKIKPSITSWGLWSVIGLAILVTYKDSGAESNWWAALFGFTNPVIISLIAIYKRGEKTALGKYDWACTGFCLLSLSMWSFLRQQPSLVQYALYTALVADTFAAIPTINFVRKHPDEDRPFAWALFWLGSVINIFAVPAHTLANDILPIYMGLASGWITYELAIFRIRHRIQLKEWI